MDATPLSRSSHRAPVTRSIADDLAALRLDDRVRRVTRVVTELRARSEAYADQGRPVPVPLSQALDDFTRQLAAARDAASVPPRTGGSLSRPRRPRRGRTSRAGAERRSSGAPAPAPGVQ